MLEVYAWSGEKRVLLKTYKQCKRARDLARRVNCDTGMKTEVVWATHGTVYVSYPAFTLKYAPIIWNGWDGKG